MKRLHFESLLDDVQPLQSGLASFLIRASFGGNKLEITMALTLHVWVRYDDPRTKVARAFAEEQKHVVGWTSVFDEFIRVAELYYENLIRARSSAGIHAENGPRDLTRHGNVRTTRWTLLILSYETHCIGLPLVIDTLPH